MHQRPYWGSISAQIHRKKGRLLEPSFEPVLHILWFPNNVRDCYLMSNFPDSLLAIDWTVIYVVFKYHP